MLASPHTGGDDMSLSSLELLDQKWCWCSLGMCMDVRKVIVLLIHEVWLHVLEAILEILASGWN